MLICIGDSLTYGHDDAGGCPSIHASPVPRSVTPYPETLAELLGHEVQNLGFPGDTAAQGLRRWPPQLGQVVLMYGTNEVLRSHTLTAGLYFWQHRTAMRRWLALYPDAWVVEPPPLANPEQDRRLRRLTAQTAVLAGPRWIPTRAALTGRIWTDGVHLKPEAYRRLAEMVIAHL